MNGKELTSKSTLQKETHEACDTKGNDVCTDAKYKVIMKRIEKLEQSMDYKFEEIRKKMESLESSLYRLHQGTVYSHT